MKHIAPENPESQSQDIVAENLSKLKNLFPDAVTEDGVNVEILKQLIGKTVTEGEEKFGLNWCGKRRARQLALTPSRGTLRPCPEDSVGWDLTQNLMIEGDNLEVLKLLQKSYAGKVKLVYIDPPYNTGKDFVYPDNYQDNIKNYLELTSQTGEGGKKLSSNTEASGRFHTDWLNMIYPRLKLARTLLREDGVICISIDDNELASLRKVGDEIFGEENFEGHIHWRRRHNQPNDPTKMLALVAEHIVVYAKNSGHLKSVGVGKIALTGSFSNPDGDPRGEWASKPWKVGTDQSGSRYKITSPLGLVLEEDWMGEEATFKALLADKRIIFPDKGKGSPRKKYFKTERAEEGQCATNWWPHEVFGHNQGANSEMETLLGEKNVFSNPKPIELLSNLIAVGNAKNTDIVLDFFAGSGTAGHAVMATNVDDNQNRRYILVQLPEQLDPDNKEQKIAAEFCDKIRKPRTIAELTKERLRRAGEKIKKENPKFAGDLGFRVFKLDSTNIREWDPNRENVAANLEASVEHLKNDRTEQDILYEVLLKLGLDLCVPIETKKIGKHEVHSIGAGSLLVCLSVSIPLQDVEPLALGLVAWHKELKPAGDSTVVFRDSAFADDVAKTNLVAILVQHGFDEEKQIKSL